MGEKTYKIIFLLIFCLGCARGLRPGYAQDLNQVLEGIHNHYKADNGLVIDYRREVKTRTMSMLGNKVKGDLASGKIYVLRPDLLKVEQKSPRKEALVTDGNLLWWIIPEEKKVVQYSSEQFGQELRIIADLWKAPSRLKKRFNITLVEEKDPSRLLLEMIPSPPWENIDRIKVQVSREFDLQVLDIINPIGTTTRFYFDKIVPAKRLTKESFKFTVPDGFTVIHEVNQ